MNNKNKNSGNKNLIASPRSSFPDSVVGLKSGYASPMDHNEFKTKGGKQIQ